MAAVSPPQCMFLFLIKLFFKVQLILILRPPSCISNVSTFYVSAELKFRGTPDWEKDSEYVLLDNGETIHLKYDPCKESSYLGDIPLSKDEFELFFERKLTTLKDNLLNQQKSSNFKTFSHHKDENFTNYFNQFQTHSHSNSNVSDSFYFDETQNHTIPNSHRQNSSDDDQIVLFHTDLKNPSWNSLNASSTATQTTERPKTTSEAEDEGHSRRRRAATAIRERLWPHGIIPYVIEGNFTGAQRAMFKQAMRHWENHTCITFIKRTVETDYIVFTHRSCGCCSYVGRKGDGSQAVSVGKNCDKFGVVVHELGHVVGFWHEHTRPDRDLYITVKYENIMEGQQYNFEKLKSDAIDSLGEPYDYGSIMHYSANTFSKNGYLPTIETSKDSLTGKPRNIGQRQGLSEGDIRQTKKLYKCKACGGSLLESEGEFTSPNHPEPYQDGLDCEWRISVTSGEKIGLNISDFDFRNPLSNVDPCQYEFLEIRDGHHQGSRLIDRYCYTRQPPIYLKSTGSRLWIRFKVEIMDFR